MKKKIYNEVELTASQILEQTEEHKHAFVCATKLALEDSIKRIQRDMLRAFETEYVADFEIKLNIPNTPKYTNFLDKLNEL